MMMMPPSTILEMQKFMHDELHGKHEASSELGDLAAQSREHRLGRFVRSLFRRSPREIDLYREGDRVESAAM